MMLVLWFVTTVAMVQGRPSTVWQFDVEKIGYPELVAATALQGLANREAPRVFLQTGARDWIMSLKSKEVTHSPAVQEKYRGVDDIWREYYAARHGLKFKDVASLDELVSKVGHGVKGTILYDEKNGGNMVVAVTLAGVRDAVPVTDRVLAASPALSRLPVLEDIRGRFPDALAAQRWAIENLLPSCSKDGVFSFTGGIDAVALDLAVSRRLFVYRLSHLFPECTPTQKDRSAFESAPGGMNPPDAPLVRTILSHLNPISPVWGWGGPREEIFLDAVSRGSAFIMCAQVPNGSFHAGIPKPQKPFRQRHLRPEDIVVQPKHYIAFMVNEGDTFKCAGSMMLNGSWLEPERGQLPINWGISPYLCEKMPGMMAYFYETMTTNDYFFDGPAGYGYVMPNSLPSNTLFRFAEKTREGNRVADTRFSECWYFYGLNPESLRLGWLAAMGIEGLTQWRGPQRVVFPPVGPVIIDSQHYYDKTSAEELAADLVAEAEKAPRPWFTVVYGGDPRRFVEISKRLSPDRFKIVRLDELFIAAGKSRAQVEGRHVAPARSVK